MSLVKDLSGEISREKGKGKLDTETYREESHMKMEAEVGVI